MDIDKVYIVFQEYNNGGTVIAVLPDEEIAEAFTQQFNLRNLGFYAYYEEHKVLHEF